MGLTYMRVIVSFYVLIIIFTYFSQTLPYRPTTCPARRYPIG